MPRPGDQYAARVNQQQVLAIPGRGIFQRVEQLNNPRRGVFWGASVLCRVCDQMGASFWVA
jgi:hypothetical protein